MLRNGDRFRIFEFDLPFSKCYKIQLTQKQSDFIANVSTKLPKYPKNDEQKANGRVDFSQKGLNKVLEQWIYLRLRCCIGSATSRQKSRFF